MGAQDLDVGRCPGEAVLGGKGGEPSAPRDRVAESLEVGGVWVVFGDDRYDVERVEDVAPVIGDRRPREMRHGPPRGRALRGGFVVLVDGPVAGLRGRTRAGLDDAGETAIAPRRGVGVRIGRARREDEAEKDRQEPAQDVVASHGAPLETRGRSRSRIFSPSPRGATCSLRARPRIFHGVRFPLSTTFLSKERADGQSGRGASALSSLELELRSAIDRAREAWPGVDVPDEAYVAYLAERVDARGDRVGAIRKAKTRDLYLTCACASGDESAVTRFDATYLVGIDASLERMKLPPSALAEAKQVLRHTLFVGQKGRPPKIAEYRGTGDLKTWVRAAAVRASFRVMRQPKGQADVDAAVLYDVPASGDVELEYLRRTYGPGFGDGLKEAFGALSAAERNLLRHHFVHGLTIDDLSSLYKVHRATAARRLVAARERLAERTREVLAVRFGVRKSEVSSLVRLIESQLDVTLGSILKRAPDDA
jgi:RNA polymerase sigma-70 factor (ECF subfamily)